MGSGTHLGRVRGLGSAKAGAHHWWLQRLTAVANAGLMIWLAVSLVRLPLGDHAAMIQWLASPLAAVPLLLLVVSVIWHLRLGLQVLIEDYVHDAGNRVAALLILNFYAAGAAAVAIFSVLKIAFGGVPA